VPSLTLQELAERLGGDLLGDPEVRIRRIAAIEEAREGDLTFLSNPRYHRFLESTEASALLVSRDVDVPGKNLLKVDDPYLALARALPLLYSHERPDPGISPAAWIAEDAVVGPDAHVAPGCYVGGGCVIGKRVVIHPSAVVRERCRLGDDVTLHPNVVLYPDTTLGDRVVVHAGTILGSDGFGYATSPKGHEKILQVGRVVVEDDVEIGANAAVDRAALGETRIGRGTKIDNLVQIGHNVRIGAGCILVGQAGISGSTRLGDGVAIAGQSGTAGHLVLGDGVRVGAKSAVYQDVPSGETVTGVPAVSHSLWKRIAASLPRLPGLLKRLRRIEEILEGRSGGDE
jgi:UDP-3-O-[3-hydroxymyristoyl] glucosamine N-acyltransferase